MLALRYGEQMHLNGGGHLNKGTGWRESPLDKGMENPPLDKYGENAQQTKGWRQSCSNKDKIHKTI